MVTPTERLYLEDDHCFENAALVLAVEADAIAFDRSCFHPGGGGQPPDQGMASIGAATVAIASIRADDDGVLWHVCAAPPPSGIVGSPAHLSVDRGRRIAVARFHTVLHVLNTIALRDYGGWITGVQIGPEYSRIDFALESLTPELCGELEAKVNAVLAGGHRLRAYYIGEAEFRRRDDLRRTLDVRPPVVDGRVRVVAIEGFDAQACGGTHVATTAEVGRFSIVRTENKGRKNKRLYVRLTPAVVVGC